MRIEADRVSRRAPVSSAAQCFYSRCAPRDWTRPQLEEAAADLERSIQIRRREQAMLGEESKHRDRIQEEERLLRQIRKRLSGT